MTNPIWIDASSKDAITSLLTELKVLSAGEKITQVASAGEGNMNVALRVTLLDGTQSQRTVVVKQARPFVAKYEAIPAPINRIHYEAKFYQFISTQADLAEKMPRWLAWLPEHHLLVLEDLGMAADATSIYSVTNVETLPDWLPQTFSWLNRLHDCSLGTKEVTEFSNQELRQLNHQHIFDLPFLALPVTDLDAVCPGLNEASQATRANPRLRKKCLELGEVYLSDKGTCLLHGDFYPGSWLLTERGLFVVDPEFCFVGPPEFDWGVAVGHLWLSGFAPSLDWLSDFVDEEKVSVRRVEQFACVEVLRRLLGVAQLPLTLDLNQRARLIAHAARRLLQE